MILFGVGILGFVLLVAWECYAFFIKFAKTFGLDGEKRTVRLVSVLTGIVLLVLSSVLCTGGIVWWIYMFVVAFLVDILYSLIKKCVWKKEGSAGWIEKIHGFGIVPILAASILVGFCYYNMMHVVETDYVVTTEKPLNHQGAGQYRVALLADWHYGVAGGMNEVASICERVSKKKPDVIILCGDLVDENTTKEEMEELFQQIGNMKSKYGIFYVYGNHDRQRYKENPAFSEMELADNITSAGITILQDEVVSITNHFTLVGREDVSYRGRQGRKSLKELFSEVDKNDFLMVLDHQPTDYSENLENGTDLLLSGHTHGGQLWPGNLIFEWFHINDAVYGKTTWTDNPLQAIVSSGVAGWQFPIKNSAPAEYVIIDIKEHE